MQCSLPVEIASMQTHNRGNNSLGSLFFLLSYCSCITVPKLRLVVCIKVILKFHGNQRILWVFLFTTDDYVYVEERVKERGIPVSLEAEEEKEVEEGVYSRSSLHGRNVLHLVFVSFIFFFF